MSYEPQNRGDGPPPPMQYPPPPTAYPPFAAQVEYAQAPAPAPSVPAGGVGAGYLPTHSRYAYAAPQSSVHIPQPQPQHQPQQAAASPSAFPAPPTSLLQERSAAGGDGVGPHPRETYREERQPPKKNAPSVEFIVGAPLHGARIGILLAVSLFGVLPLMSTFTMTALLSGVMLTYMSDYLGYARMTVSSLVGTVLLFGVSLFLSNLHAAVTSFGPLLMIIDLTGVLGLTCAAALLHFRGLQESYPDTICRLERLVLVVAPVLALPSLLTTATALTGSRYAPLWFLVIMCVEHYYFYCPLKSSFMIIRRPRTTPLPTAAASSSPEDALLEKRRLEEAQQDCDEDEELVPQQINERSDAIAFTLLLITLPVLVYNAFQSNWGDNVLANMLNSFGILCGAFAYLCVYPQRSLWFLAPPPNSKDSVVTQLAYDPLGLQDCIANYRTAALCVTGIVGSHWCAYALMTGSYAYIFNGVPFPFNMALLLIALYVAVFVGVVLVIILDADDKGKNAWTAPYQKHRVALLIGPIITVVLLSIVSGAPGFFAFMGVMSVISFSTFLIDRTNGGPMVSFCIFSSMQLLWWMYRTFSFVVVDLKVIGSNVTVPSPAVAVAVLWSYVLGCICFSLSFSKDKGMLLVFMFLHASEITFVETVLYSQKEDNSYPALLVFFTSAVGVVVGCRMYWNGVLDVFGAAFVVSCYLAKTFSFLVTVTSSYYHAEDETYPFAEWLLPMEITGGWWVALAALYTVSLFEIERRRMEARKASMYLYLYVAAAVLLTLGTMRNVQRAVYEFVTQSYVASDELPHIILGTGLATFSLLLWPFMSRRVEMYPTAAGKWVSVGRVSAVLGGLALLVQPTRVAEGHVSGVDFELVHAGAGRYASAFGLLLLVGGRMLPLHKAPLLARAVYWLVAAAALAFGVTTTLLPVFTLPLFGCIFAFVFLAFLLIDLSHYRVLTSIEGWIVYAMLMAVMMCALLCLHRVNVVEPANGNLSHMWYIYEQGRMQLLSVVAVANLFIAVLLRARLSGRPLLPHCVPINDHIVSQVGVVTNYATLIAVTILCVLNYWGNDSEPGLYVVTGLFLLLMVDDDTLFFDLNKGNFRYFPPALFSVVAMWGCVVHTSYLMATGIPEQILQILIGVVKGLPLLPAQISLLRFLWRSRAEAPRRFPPGPPTSSRVTLWVSLLLSIAVLVCTSRKSLQWMAITCVCGQTARLFSDRLSVNSKRPVGPQK